MIGYATAIVVGCLSRDPELRWSGEGEAWVTLTVKVSRANGYEKTASFIECKKRGPDAEEIARTYRQGDEVHIEGSLIARKFPGSEKRRLIVEAASVERMSEHACA